MAEKKMFPQKDIEALLKMYGFDPAFSEQTEYISNDRENGNNYIKIILSVLLESGKRIILKIRHEDDDIRKDRTKTEKRSAFSELMRQNGILTPRRYMADGRFCIEYEYHGLPCNITAEDWCGREITEIDAEISYKIGELMARMHLISLKNKCRIGCGTLFSAAYWNDIDAYEQFCEICEDKHLDPFTVEQIKALRNEKLEALRAVWDRLPKAAVQGDISINNLVYGEDALTVFDYNNAGDEVLISDLVMEGLLTAYEMDLPEGTEPGCREQLFPALLKGYLSRRKLNREEADAAWTAYTLYHSLWFSRVHYDENALEKLVEREDYISANRLLQQMLADMTEADDGRFRQ